VSLPTISQAIAGFLGVIEQSRSAHTYRAYQNGLNHLRAALEAHALDAQTTPAADFPGDAVLWLAEALKGLAPASERLYLAAALKFCAFLVAEDYAPLNLERVRLRLDLYARPVDNALPHFSEEAVRTVLAHAARLGETPPPAETRGAARQRLLDLRDAALILTLADTGLRIHEACALTRGQLNWHEGRTLIKGKGGREAIIRFSNRAQAALQTYLKERDQLYPDSGHRLKTTEPLFCGHGKRQVGDGYRLRPLSTKAARELVQARVVAALGAEAAGTITPHTFRHYFVTTVMRASGGDLKLAQEMARHADLSTTSRYAHLTDETVDRQYHEIFNQE
jgi:site-specific recombinase XerD